MTIRTKDKFSWGSLTIITLLAIVGDIVTIKSDLLTVIWGKDSIPQWASISIYIALLPLFGCILWILYQCTIMKYLRSIGINNTATSYKTFWRFKVSNKNGHIFHTYHYGFYHSVYKIRDKIIRNIVDKNGLQSLIAAYIAGLNNTIHKEIGLDLNIRVLLLAEDDDKRLLVPYCHSRSVYEIKSNTPRKYDYKYFLLTDDSSHLSNHCNKAIEYNNKNGNGLYSTNSIFSYLVGSTDRHWLSNNIDIDRELNNFYSSCDCKVEGDIKSLAVFKLSPPESNPETRGFIIFDTHDKGAFCQKECVPLFGLVAHLINELFELIENKTNGQNKKN